MKNIHLCQSILILSVVFFSVSVLSSASKVVELSDRFLELRGESTWLIMFYAPWCGHCKKLDPTWNHVSQVLYGTEIRVGRVDCTRFTSMANEFKIKGFPTIMYVRGEDHHYYSGDRTTDEIVGFGYRMAGPPVPELNAKDAKAKLHSKIVFFLYVGTREGILWDLFYHHALNFRYHHFFYTISPTIAREVLNIDQSPAIVSFKNGKSFSYAMPSIHSLSDTSLVNGSLFEWINHERFPSFVKFTHGNLPELWKVKKYLAIAVFEENKIGELKNQEEINFRSMIEEFGTQKREKYNSYFQFGWTGTPDLANSIAMERLKLPSFIVVNTSLMQYHIPEDIPYLTEKSLEEFFDTILSKSAPVYGGNGWFYSFYRTYFNSKTSLEDMWHGNPVLTSVLFGLPMGFLSLICYSIWCSDLLDADEEDEREEKHIKKE